MKNIILKFIYLLLRKMARKVILRHNPYVIAVTGSVGKTSAKESIYRVLQENFGNQVRASYGNLNAEIGIPLTILGYSKIPSKILWPFFLIAAWTRTLVSKYPKYLILEMGIEHPGDIEYFGTIVNPDIGIITATTPAHVANFESLAAMQQEKIGMSKIIKKEGIIIVNLDDEILSKHKFVNPISFAIKNDKADCLAENILITEQGMNYTVIYRQEKNLISTSILGEHLIYAHLTAFCVGKKLNISSEKIVLALEKQKSIPGRMNLLKGRDKVMIIDDTYNSNPASARAALKTLSEIKYSTGRKVAILGNMNELGSLEEENHIKIAKYARGKCDLIIFSGSNAQAMYQAYDDKKISLKFKNRSEIIKSLDKIIKPSDIVLIKASQNNNYFEEITKELLNDKSEADKVLVRQGSFWQKKKKT